MPALCQHDPPKDWCHVCHPEIWASIQKAADKAERGTTHPSRSRSECIHRGGQVRQVDPTCASTRTLACDIHGECVTAEMHRTKILAIVERQPLLAGLPLPTVCATCPDYVSKNSPKTDPKTSAEAMAAEIKAGHSLPAGWEKWGTAPAAHRLLLEEAIEKAPPYPVDRYSGRGIVIAAGGGTYFACAWVGFSILRWLGCTLPVQFWHLGRSEFDPSMAEVCQAAGVEVIDASAVADGLPLTERPRRLNGWELKAFAVQQSRFEEVLFLDADNVAVRDPTFLFDDPAYLAHGSVFWPDLPPPGKRGVWIAPYTKRALGISPKCADSAFESGQFVINKRLCWRELIAARNLNDHSDFWYHLVYGDKDTFWLAWHKLDRAYAMPTRPGWRHPSILQYGLDRKPLFEHVCQGKAELAGGQRIHTLTHRDECVDAAACLRRVWSGQIWSWADQTEEEKRLAVRLAGRWWYEREGHGGRPLGLHIGGGIGEGSAGCEKRWRIAILSGTPTIVIVGEAHKGSEVGMMFLNRESDHTWRGQWEAFERSSVELKRL